MYIISELTLIDECQMKTLRILYIIIGVIIFQNNSFAQQSSHLEIRCEAFVDVFLDEKYVGKTKADENGLLLSDLSSGKHTIKFDKQGYEIQEDIVNLKPGQVYTYIVRPFIKLKTRTDKGSVIIQSLPTNITVLIPQLDVNLEKSQDILNLSNLKSGTYNVTFKWKNKAMVHVLEIVPEKTQHLLVNMASLQISEINDIDVDISDEIMVAKELPELEMILVDGGSFDMGSETGGEDEIPVHEVELEGFYISKYEITHGQYVAFLNDVGVDEFGTLNGIKYFNIDDEQCAIKYRQGKFEFWANAFITSDKVPMLNVSWYGASAYAKWAGGKLPSEAQWEYAARGGQNQSDLLYAGSNTLEDVAEFGGNNYKQPMPVGGKTPNELGIYDMSGNVWEWVDDWYDRETYFDKDRDNPKGPVNGEFKVNRGGSWACFARFCRNTNRYKNKPEAMFNYLGFRIVRSVK